MATSLEELRGLGAKAGPRFVEPRRGLVKAMARRAKMSHLGAFQILPEHVVLSCLARVPREDHDAVADCSTGFRALMRSERFVKARRAEDITEETFVAVTRDCGLLALVSGRMWRRLAPMPPEMRVDLDSDIRFWGSGITVIGTELFIAGGVRSDGSCAVAVHDAVDDSWFSMPLPPSCPINFFALGCAGRLFGGAFKGYPYGTMAPAQNSILFWSWDANSQEWVELPTMPQSMGYSRGVDGDNLDSLITVAAEGEIFICDRYLSHFCVFDVLSETWRLVDIPLAARYLDQYSPSLFYHRGLVHVLRHRGPDDLRLGYGHDHMAYDTISEVWVSITGGLPRHTARGPKYVLGVVNHNGPDDYLMQSEKGERGASSCSVHFYVTVRRDNSFGHDVAAWKKPINLPIRYDAFDQVASVAMP